MKIQNPKTIKPYILAGNATFTIFSKKINTRYTFNVKQDKMNKNKYIVSALYGDNNVNDYRFIGLLFNDKVCLDFISLEGFGFANQMFSQFVLIIDELIPWPDTCEFYASTCCAKCGRLLTTPESIIVGVGPKCYESLKRNKIWLFRFEQDKEVSMT